MPDPEDPEVEERQLETEMQRDLETFKEHHHGSNPVYTRSNEHSTAKDAAASTMLEARVAGEEAAEADRDRLDAEKSVSDIESREPGTDKARDAEQVLAEIERAADDAIAASLDSDQRAASSLTTTSWRHPEPGMAEIAKGRAEEDVREAGQDLTKIEELEKRIEADAEG